MCYKQEQIYQYQISRFLSNRIIYVNPMRRSPISRKWCRYLFVFWFQSPENSHKPLRKSSSLVESSSEEEVMRSTSAEKIATRLQQEIENQALFYRKRKSRYMDYYNSNTIDDVEEQRKLQEKVQQQTAPENYVVMPHRKRRPGFHNSPAQNPPFIPFSPSYIDEISFRWVTTAAYLGIWLWEFSSRES